MKRPKRKYGEHWPEFTERLEKCIDQLEAAVKVRDEIIEINNPTIKPEKTERKNADPALRD